MSESHREKAERARDARAVRKVAGACINGWSHGKATHGVRCERCYHVHRGSAGLRDKSKPQIRELVLRFAATVRVRTGAELVAQRALQHGSTAPYGSQERRSSIRGAQ
jgi:hypothetical protein